MPHWAAGCIGEGAGHEDEGGGWFHMAVLQIDGIVEEEDTLVRREGRNWCGNTVTESTAASSATLLEGTD